MASNADLPDVEGSGPRDPDLDDLTGYEDGDSFVIRDEENPNAWIRSDLVQDLRL